MFEDPGQARREESTAETVKDNFDHAPRVGSEPQRPKKHFQRPSGGLLGEDLHCTTSTKKACRKFDLSECQRRENST